MKHLTAEELEAAAQPGEPGPLEAAVGPAAHLRECSTCREAAKRVRGRQMLLKGLKPYTLSDVAFSRIDARLVEHVREVRRPRAWWLWAPLGVAAAAAVAFAVLSTLKPAPAAFEPMTVAYAAGETPLKAGDVLGRGSAVSAKNATLQLMTADGDALRLWGGASFQLGIRDAAVAFDSGRLVVDASRGGPWRVRVSDHYLETTDAHLEVSPEAIDLSRGSVRVFDDAMWSRARLVHAPAHVDLRTGAVGPLAAPLTTPAPGVKPPWAKLVLGLQADDVELDGQKVGPSPLSLLTAPGRHHLSAAGRETDVELTTAGSGIVELPEKPVVAAPKMPSEPQEPQVEADPDAIAKAIRAQLPKLRVCHDKWLKVDPSAKGRVEMTLTVSRKGKVTKTAFTAAEGVPPAIDDCLARAARTLILPRSSEEVELELPVLLGGGQ